MGEKEKPKTNYVALVALVLFAGGAVMVKSCTVQSTRAREAVRRMVCTKNLKAIELAMHGYHDKYGRFPPAYTVDAEGKPLHSWRALLLPFLERGDIYREIKFDEPWDSPANLAVYEKSPMNVYQCPSDPGGDETKAQVRTNYVMVLGPKCVSDGPHSRGLEELPQKGEKTIHVVETVAPIRWYEPRDLKAEEIDFTVDKAPTGDGEIPGIDSYHPGLVIAAFCDGRTEVKAEVQR